MFFNLIVYVAILSLALGEEASCIHKVHNGIHFDLTPLRNDKEDYHVYDYLQVVSNQTYVFNICRNVVSIPKDGAGGEKCKSTVHDVKDDGTVIMEDRPVPAFLVTEDNCHRLSAPIEDHDFWWSPYDYNDLTAGITLRYDGGDYFIHNWFYYSLTLSFRCSSRTTIPEYADVYHAISSSTLWLDSVYACPVECFPDEKGNICSGHGICMMDDSIDACRCFCNAQNKGERCEKSVGLSMTGIFMILDIVAVVIVLFTIIYLGCKLRKIRLDPDADVSLDTKFNELGSLAYTV